jgi:hypothetical protein
MKQGKILVEKEKEIMLKEFRKDLVAAQEGERRAEICFRTLGFDKYDFKNVGENPAYYDRGDILAIDKETGKEVCIEIKQDSRIAQTHNVLLEDEVDYFGVGLKKGNLHSNYEIYAIVSPQKEKILVLDFEVLKKNYRKGTYKIIPHEEQVTFCYLLPIETIEKLGGVIAVIDYSKSIEVTYKRAAA